MEPFSRTGWPHPVHGLFLACILVLSAASSVGQENDGATPENDVNFEELISQLSDKNPFETRIKAANLLGDHQKDPRSLQAVAALTMNLRDKDPDVRFFACSNLTFILKAHDRECPIEVLELVDDSSPRMKTNLLPLWELYEKFPPEAIEFGLRLYEAKPQDEKSDTLVLLSKMGGKDKRVMQILWSAVNSDDAGNRINATAGLWAATKDFELVIPLYFDRLADANEIRSLPNVDDSRFTGSHPKARIQLAELGLAIVFCDHLAERHDEFVKALQAFAASRSAITRRNLSGYLRRCLGLAVSNRSSKAGKKFEHPDIEYMQLRRIVNKMTTDADETVAKNAKAALQVLDELAAKTKDD